MKLTHFFKALVLTSLVCWLFSDTFVWLYDRFDAVDSYYSHGFLIPFVSMYIIWSNRKSLGRLEVESSVLGLVIIATSFLLHIVGTFVHFYFISGIALFILPFGISLYLFGRNITKEILFPLVFLIFMIPMPTLFINALLYPMKVFVVKTSMFFIKMAQIPIFVEGFNVTLTSGTLQVGNPCSGLRSLIAFLAMGAMMGYLFANSKKDWMIIIGMSIPIAFISNIIRTLFLILTAVFIDIEKVRPDYWLHDFSGIVVFVFGLIIMITIGRKLECREIKNKPSFS